MYLFEVNDEPREHSFQTIDFRPVLRKTRKPGTGCITQINNHLWEGRYSPIWQDGKRHAKGVTRRTAAKWYEIIRGMLGRIA